jgi:hypothetical protein
MLPHRARLLVGAALVGRAVQAQRFPDRQGAATRLLAGGLVGGALHACALRAAGEISTLLSMPLGS